MYISDAKESIWKYRMFLNFNFYTKVRKKIRTLIKMQVGMKISNMHIINIQNTKDKWNVQIHKTYKALQSV